jgi:hypothetical protein
MIVDGIGDYDIKIITYANTFVQTAKGGFPSPLGQIGANYRYYNGKTMGAGTVVIRINGHVVTKFPAAGGSYGTDLILYAVDNTNPNTKVWVYGRWKGD